MITFQCPECDELQRMVTELLKVGDEIDLYCANCNIHSAKMVIETNEKLPVEPEKNPLEETEMQAVTAQVTMYNDSGYKRITINPRELVKWTGNTKDTFKFSEVQYYTRSGILYQGWVETEFLEPFVENGGIIKVDSPTVYQGDAAQYLMYVGVQQYNLCGEFAVLYCAGWDDQPIETWLDEWKVKDLSGWDLVFRNKYSRTTGIPDLERMFQTFDGYTEKFERLTDSFYLPSRKRPHFTPYRLKEFLLENYAIIGCKISSYTGRLEKSGTPHWVVVESMSPYRHGGVVTIYNPFSNAMEEYSWEEFYASVTGTPFGIRVPRR